MAATRSDLNQVNETLAKHEVQIGNLEKKIEKKFDEQARKIDEQSKKANERLDRLEGLFKKTMERMDDTRTTMGERISKLEQVVNASLGKVVDLGNSQQDEQVESLPVSGLAAPHAPPTSSAPAIITTPSVVTGSPMSAFPTTTTKSTVNIPPTGPTAPIGLVDPTASTGPTGPTMSAFPIGPTHHPAVYTEQSGFAPRAELRTDTLQTPWLEGTLPGPRDEKGRLIIHGHFDPRFRFCKETAAQTHRVKQVWPKLIGEDDLQDHESRNSNAKNRSVWSEKQKMKNTRDPHILQKLELIQAELRDTLVPYKTWPARILPLLEEDFIVVARFLKDYSPSWALAVEAILSRLDRSGALDHPWFAFTSLRPMQGEVYQKFANRLREAVYNLPETIREDRTTRSILCTIAQNYLPKAWVTCEEAAREWTCYYLADRLCEITKHIDRAAIEQEIYTRPSASVALQGKTAPFYQLEVAEEQPGQSRPIAKVAPIPTMTTMTPMIANPLADDTRVTATNEQAAAVRAGNCFKCGKPGHYAPECRDKRSFGSRPTGNSTINFRGTATFARNLTKRLSEFQEKRDNQKGKRRQDVKRIKGKKVHYATDADEEDEAGEVKEQPSLDEEDQFLARIEEETYNAIVDDYFNAASQAHDAQEEHEG